MKSRLSLSEAILGYTLHAQIERLSPHTIADYSNVFRKLQAFLNDDVPFESITLGHLLSFFADLATPRAPAGVAKRPARTISKKTQLNYHTALGALWTWAVKENFVAANIVHSVPRPKPEKRVIVGFSLADVKALLGVIDRTRTYRRPGQRAVDNARTTALRDRAIVLLLIDTGIRASELCGLQVRHVDLRNGAVTVFGKGAKERHLPISPRTTKALLKHLTVNRKEARVNEPVFVTVNDEPLTRNALLKLCYSLGQRAGVADVHPHRFRHTYAIEYLRNGGNARSLQVSLGHESFDMIQTYTMIAESDLKSRHEVASPVDNWGL